MSRYIDADELWKEIESVEYYGCDAEVSRICGLIQNAPTAKVKPIVYGKWKRNETSLVYKCSNCKEARVMFPYPYCPMCGAEMVNSAKW